jgi:dephospho-CoA kinase
MSRPGSKEHGLSIALTGGIACGKSAAARVLAAHGAAVLDTDEVAHELLRKGSPVRDRVVEVFGKGILDAAGDVERKALGAIVFADAAKRERLEALIHPAIMARVGEWVGEHTLAGRDAVVVVPLLFEIGAEKGWDAIVCVLDSDERALERLRARGWSDEESQRRMSAQWPAAKKALNSNVVIENKGSLADLERTTAAAYKELREKEK